MAEEEKFLDKARNVTSDLRRMIYDINSDNEDIKSHISSIDSEIFKTLQGIENDTNGSIATIIQNINAESAHEKQFLQSFKDQLSEEQDMSFIKNLYTENENYNNNIDFESIKTFIPDLAAALTDLTNSIISPDDFASSISDHIMYKDANVDDDKIIQLKENINDNYDIDGIFEKLIEKSLEKGRHYIFIKSYEDIFQEILEKKETQFDSKGRHINEALEIKLEDFLQSEDGKKFDIEKSVEDILSEGTYEIPKGSSKKETVNEFKNVLDKVSIMDNNITMGCINEVKAKVDIANDIKGATNIRHLIKKDSEVISDDGLVDKGKKTRSNSKSRKALGLEGVYIELIDREFIIPVKVNDSILGYYYIEAQDTLTSIATNPRKHRRKNYMNPNDTSTIGMNDSMMTDTFFSQMSEFIVKKLDKKFIENNKELKEDLYNIIKYNDNYKKELKISFIEKEFIEEVEIDEGKGVFYYSLTLARIYISILLTYFMLKVTRSKDEILYYVRQSTVDSDIGGSVNSAIRSVQRKTFDAKSLLTGSVDNLYSLGNGNFNKHYIPVDKNGNKALDTEILSAQDTSVPDDLLDKLLSMIRNSTGVPSVILNFSNEADYSRTLVTANAKYLRTILGLQRFYNKKLSRIYVKIAKIEIEKSEGSYDDVEPELFKLVLPTPRTLTTTTNLDLFNIYDGMIANVLKAAIPENEKDEVRYGTYKRLMRYYNPSEDWELVDEFVKQARMENTITSNDEDELNTSKF